VGCPSTASHTGYKGRTGVYELMVADDAMRALIHNRVQTKAGPRSPRPSAGGLRAMRADGERLVRRRHHLGSKRCVSVTRDWNAGAPAGTDDMPAFKLRGAGRRRQGARSGLLDADNAKAARSASCARRALVPLAVTPVARRRHGRRRRQAPARWQRPRLQTVQRR
jgi:hypothetical protein